LTWGQVLTVEVIFGICLLAVLCGLAVTGYKSAIAKARLSQVFTDFAAQRLAIQEQWALTGEGFPSYQSELSQPAGATSGRGETRKLDIRYAGPEFEYSVTRIENALIARGTLGESKTPFFLSYTPAVIASGVPGSMMWFCGNRKPPAGWTLLPGPTGTDLPSKYLFSVCRDNRES
jgi:Tfp pilus assembly protein PilE